MATRDNIKSAALAKLQSLGFTNASLLAECMAAQSQHETGNYTSNIFQSNNNAFGYKYYAGSSYQQGIGDVSEYGNYATVEDSAREVAAWIGRRKTTFASVKTVDDYVSGLKKNSYFEDTLANYLAGVKRYFTSSTAHVIGLAVVPLLIVGGILAYKFLA